MKISMTLAKNTNTPIGFWLDMPVPELRMWIDVNNEVYAPKEQQ